ncbi:MAG: lytic transglycosylase domain-containing protein [Sphingomonadaceae bacterium]|nr:lytic transglycosylase domain-containing protein [Sphingomonadaceae bacterium]
MTTNTAWAIKTATIFALAVMPAQLLAKSGAHAPAPVTRKVVLMDFTQTPQAISAPTADAGDTNSPIADVARQMASSFTNSSPSSIDDFAPADTWPMLSAASLPNPFITRAIAPFGAIPAPALNAGGFCANYAYQDDFSHGRAAAERRRLIYPLVHQVACEQGLPIGLFDALIMQESRYNHMAISPKGALGLAQLMPATARQLGANPYAVIENLRGGARYLRLQVDRFGRYDLALAAYNAGPGRVARYGRVPAIAETIGYVRNISAKWGGPPGVQVASMTSPFVGRRAQMIFMPYYKRPFDGSR